VLGYISKINGYHYFTQIDKTPKLNSYVIQVKIKSVHFYTLNKSPTESWTLVHPYFRKYKIDRFTREIIFTDDPKLSSIKKLDFSKVSFSDTKPIDIQQLFK
jgi:hypothetical protein